MKQRYRRPPLVEALCEVAFRGSQWDDTLPGQFYDAIKLDFPKRQQVAIAETQLRVSPSGEVSTSVTPKPPRMRFLSEGGDRIVQVGEEILVVNQLPPYPSFEEWAPVVEEKIGLYADLAKPAAATQAGVRYINRISFNDPQVRMEDWFTIYPEVPEALGTEHGPFLLRLQLAGRRPETHVLLTFGSAPPDGADRVAHLLDVYVRIPVPSETEMKLVMPIVREAQEEAEKVFEATITQRLRDRFQPEDSK